MKMILSGALILLILISGVNVAAFTYDAKNLERDLSLSSEVVVAVKVSGRISPLSFDSYRSAFYPKDNDAGLEKAWNSLSEYNRRSTPSAFMVTGSIRGNLKIGDVFHIDDEWIPVELGSVALYFLHPSTVHFVAPEKRPKNYYESNPCHRFTSETVKQLVASSGGDYQSIIDGISRNRLSFCDDRLNI